MRRFAIGLLVAASVTACTKTHAKTPTGPVALATPAPPDRVIIPASIPEAVPLPTLPAPASSMPARPRETPAPRSERPAAPAPAPQPAPPAAAEPAPAPPPVLQMTTNPEEVEQRARASMSAAQRDLAYINPAQLTSNARAQYDTARAFIRQAETALKVKNVVLARELAEKAAALASQLRR